MPSLCPTVWASPCLNRIPLNLSVSQFIADSLCCCTQFNFDRKNHATVLTVSQEQMTRQDDRELVLSRFSPVVLLAC